MLEKFCLKWNDFNSNVSKSFSKLRNENEFFDVALVSDDLKLISAHKVVLSASSEYFKNILKQQKHPNPLLCLEGISSTELNDILDYVYHGEVNVNQEDLDRFLKIANRLKLEGLMSPGENYKETWDQHCNTIKLENDIKNIVPDTKDMGFNDALDNSEIKTFSPVKTKIVLNAGEFKCIDELDEKILEYLEKDIGRKWKCTICDKVVKDKTCAKEHVEIHYEGLQFSCPEGCGAVFRSRNTLRFHTNKKHRV